jgi:uroporphyrinogen-III synthase
MAWPATVRAGSTGPGTSAALREAGVPEGALVEPAADAPNFDSEALWVRLQALPWAGRRVLVVRGEEGRDWLAEHLRGAGAVVEFIAAYRRQPPQPDAAGWALLQAALAEPARHLWHFSSSESVAQLRALAPQVDWSRSAALASHPRIAQAAREAGFGQVELVDARLAAVAARARAGAPIQSSPL